MQSSIGRSRHKELDNKLAVEDANKAFYDAFVSGSIKVSSARSSSLQ
jgi:hypothetical protein